MNKYEFLMFKSNLCLDAGLRCSKNLAFEMSDVWIRKAEELTNKALNLLVDEVTG